MRFAGFASSSLFPVAKTPKFLDFSHHSSHFYPLPPRYQKLQQYPTQHNYYIL
jgi:hypothetical protein